MRTIMIAELRKLEDEVNRALSSTESDHRVEVIRREGDRPLGSENNERGYCAVDLYDANTASVLRTLATGTRKEVYMYLKGVSDWLMIAG